MAGCRQIYPKLTRKDEILMYVRRSIEFKRLLGVDEEPTFLGQFGEDVTGVLTYIAQLNPCPRGWLRALWCQSFKSARERRLGNINSTDICEWQLYKCINAS